MANPTPPAGAAALPWGDNGDDVLDDNDGGGRSRTAASDTSGPLCNTLPNGSDGTRRHTHNCTVSHVDSRMSTTHPRHYL